MAQECSGYGISSPNYAKDVRVLVVDSDMSSLVHTTSVLEEATYEVTSIEFPSVALKMMQERANMFDLVIAAMEMPEMDGFTFLKIAKHISHLPVVLTTYNMNESLMTTARKEGACELCMNPIKQEDAKSFWQHVYAKGSKKNDDNNSSKMGEDLPQNQQLAEGASGHKENSQVLRKRKGVQCTTECETTTSITKNDKIRWSTGVQQKFMETLMKGNQEAMFTATQPGPGSAYLAMLASQKTNERGTNTTSTTGMIQAHGVSNSANLTNANYARNNFQSLGPNLRQQPRSVLNNADSIRRGYRFLQENGLSQVDIRPFARGRSSLQLHGTTRLNLGNNSSRIGKLSGTSSMNTNLKLLNTKNRLAFTETFSNESLLKARIEQIRRAHRGNNISEKASPTQNLEAEKVKISPSTNDRNGSHAEYISNEDVRNTCQLVSNQTNVPEGNTISNYGNNGLTIMSSGFSLLQSSCLPYTNQYPCASSEYHGESSIQNPINLVAPKFYSNNNNLIPNSSLENQAIQPTNDLVGNNLVDAGVTSSTTGLFQTPFVPNFDSNNNNLLPSYGIETQAIMPSNDLIGNNNLNFGASSPTTGFFQTPFVPNLDSNNNSLVDTGAIGSTAGLFQTSVVPNFDSNYNNLLPYYDIENQAIRSTNDLVGNNFANTGVTGSTTGIFHNPFVPNYNSNSNNIVPSNGLQNHAIQTTNDLVGNNLVNTGVTGFTEQILNNVDASGSHQLTEESGLLDAILSQENYDNSDCGLVSFDFKNVNNV